MGCLECFATGFKTYHFDNFTFSHSKATLRTQNNSSITSKTRTYPKKPPLPRTRRRLSKKAFKSRRASVHSTIGDETNSSSSISIQPLRSRVPKLPQEEVRQESLRTSVLKGPNLEAPKAPKRVSFAHVTVQRSISSKQAYCPSAYNKAD